MQHPAYEHDSKLNDRINYDLLSMLTHINEPESEARRRLLG